jgi:hypothetical protein
MFFQVWKINQFSAFCADKTIFPVISVLQFVRHCLTKSIYPISVCSFCQSLYRLFSLFLGFVRPCHYHSFKLTVSFIWMLSFFGHLHHLKLFLI